VDTVSLRDIEAERAQLRQTLHQRGMRMTPQRQLVLDALVELEHATPERVCQHVQRSTPTVNITTIYRTLELLESLGIVRHTHLGHGAPSYSVHEHGHVHLVCHSCGDVIEAPREVMEELRGTLRGRYGFALDVSHLALSGTCRKCSGDRS
jgi:Fur family transcriptional regulator, ferric uptake regulator